MPRRTRASPTRSTAQLLAQDVLLLVFDAFVLRELLVFSLVCRHWRSAARAHPTFWRSIALVKPTREALDVFLDRLGQKKTALVSLTVTPPALPLQLVNDTVDAIQKNIGRIKTLSLDFNSFPASALQRVMRALSDPAPALERLILKARTTNSSRVVLRRTLFASEAPQLRHVSLEGIALDRMIPSAFGNTTELTYKTENGSGTLSIQQILKQLPGLQGLHVASSWFPAMLCAVPALQLGALRTLQIDYVHPNLADSLNSFQDLHTISVSRLSSSASVNDAFFGHLNGTLHMHISHSGWNVKKDCVRIMLQEKTGDRPHRARVIEQMPIQSLLSWPGHHPAGQLAGRIASAYLPIGVLYPISVWLDGCAPALRKLRLLIDRRTDGPLQAGLQCPALQRLTLVGGKSGRDLISAGDIEFLQDDVLEKPEVAVKLEEIAKGGPDRFINEEFYDSEFGSSDDDDDLFGDENGFLDFLDLMFLSSALA